MYIDRLSARKRRSKISGTLILILVLAAFVPASAQDKIDSGTSWWPGTGKVTKRESWSQARGAASQIARARALAEAVRAAVGRELVPGEIDLLQRTILKEKNFYGAAVSHVREGRSGRNQVVRLWLSVDMAALEARLVGLGLIQPWDDKIKVVSLRVYPKEGWLSSDSSQAYPIAISKAENYLSGFGISSQHIAVHRISTMAPLAVSASARLFYKYIGEAVSDATNLLLWEVQQLAVPDYGRILLQEDPQKISYKLLVREPEGTVRVRAEGVLKTTYNYTATGAVLEREMQDVGDIAPLIRTLFEVRRTRLAPWRWNVQFQGIALLEAWSLAQELSEVPGLSGGIPARIEPDKGPALLLRFFSTGSTESVYDGLNKVLGNKYSYTPIPGKDRSFMVRYKGFAP